MNAAARTTASRRGRVRLWLLVGLLFVVLALIPFRAAVQRRFWDTVAAGRSSVSTAQRVRQYGAVARGRLQPLFRSAGVAYPPTSMVWLALKLERQLELWGAGAGGVLRRVHVYPILAASGDSGPKLKRGDGQVPEGFYRLEAFNPNSRYHLSLRVNYPNDFDRASAAREGRTDLGGDIMIHGANCSIGCLAMGDPAIEELFVLAADVGLPRIELLIAPCDLRKTELPPGEVARLPAWMPDLYRRLKAQMLSQCMDAAATP